MKAVYLNQNLGIAYRFLSHVPKNCLGGGFRFLCSSLFGEDFQFDYFSKGLVQPPTSCRFCAPTCFLGEHFFVFTPSIFRQKVYFADLAGRENERSTQVPGGAMVPGVAVRLADYRLINHL